MIKQNLPGGTSAVVPPDPMPNSEVKRRSADGSVGSPHVRVGNRQASNKAEGPVERLGLLLLCYLLSVDKQSCHQGETRQSRFARNAARDREFICPVVMWMMSRRADTGSTLAPVSAGRG